jgi:aldehyde:ferredoxin oxidoreductase
MPHGWTGRVLEVDLTRGQTRVIEPAAEIYEREIGGKGLGGYYLYERAALPWDDPQLPLLLFTGPLVGTAAPTSGRMHVLSRSPLTGTVGDVSVGGGLGTEIKRAGYDGIIVRGRAPRWTGIEIADDAVRFVDATGLVGLPVGTAAARLAGRGSVALIGPAAEHGVRFASLMVDRHYVAARGGIGLSFAAKRLKYFSVSGSGAVAVADPERLRIAREDVFRLAAASSVLLGEHGLAARGTPALYDLMHARRMMPTDNFARTRFAAAPGLNASALARRFNPKRVGCNGCHILCKKRTAGGEHLPEFETLSHFTALIGNADLEVAVAANDLCNELGMDTISAASTIACYREISGDEIDGPRLLGLLEQIGRGAAGLGADLGQGSKAFAAGRGRPELSMSVKGQELPAYDPRGAYGMALGYAVSTRGGCHLRAYPIGHEILRKPVATDRFSFAGKARIIKIAEDLNAVIDSLTACKFIFFAASLEEYAKAFTAVTGVPRSSTELSFAGERIYYRERLINARCGFTARDDDLPPRFFTEPGSAGPGFEVPPIDRPRFLAARAAYYRVRGLDANGLPLAERAAALELPWNDC